MAERAQRPDIEEQFAAVDAHLARLEQSVDGTRPMTMPQAATSVTEALAGLRDLVASQEQRLSALEAARTTPEDA
jgi:hypothetical protein